MIALQLPATGTWLDLGTGALSVEIHNPLFDSDAVPGTLTYPFTLPLTATNLRALNFPHRRAAQGEAPAPEPAAFYVEGLLWRVGQLLYLGCDEEKDEATYQFAADAGELATRLEGLTLPELALGQVPLQLVPDAADYALPVLRSTTFYGEKNPTYGGYLNYYHPDGDYARNSPTVHAFPLVPCLRLVPLLRRVLGVFGYAVQGPWADSAEAQALVLYTGRAADQAGAPGGVAPVLEINRYVPALGVGEWLVALQQALGLGYVFDAQRRTLMIHALRAVVADPTYRDREPAGRPRCTLPNEPVGVLKMALPDDEQNETLDTSWAELRIGPGKDVLAPALGTLHVRDEADARSARTWRVPTIEATGRSAAFELGDEPTTALLLLFDRGLRPDSNGVPYPLATWGRTDLAGTVVGASELHWAGPHGLYAQAQQPWLAFLATAAKEERLMQFAVADLLALDPLRKELVEHRKFLWEKVSLSLSPSKPLRTARFTYRYVKQ